MVYIYFLPLKILEKISELIVYYVFDFRDYYYDRWVRIALEMHNFAELLFAYFYKYGGVR